MSKKPPPPADQPSADVRPPGTGGSYVMDPGTGDQQRVGGTQAAPPADGPAPNPLPNPPAQPEET